MNTDSIIMQSGWLIVGTTAAALLVSLWMRLAPESTPVARGSTDANMVDCIACHGQPGDGFPDDSALECTNVNHNALHSRYKGKCSDLLAFFEVVRLKRTFRTRVKSPSQNRLLQGERLARQYSCFHCHGELGQGGFHNSGALKGYVPGYFGDDFAQLTRNGSAESVRAWISQGIDPALFAKPIEGVIARFFIERQDVGMPNFGTLSESKIEILTDYVRSLNKFGEMGAKEIRTYSLLTQKRWPPSTLAL